MQMLSENDRNLSDMTDEELALAWDLWFDLSQSTNDYDPPYAHGVFAGLAVGSLGQPQGGSEDPAPTDETIASPLDVVEAGLQTRLKGRGLWLGHAD